MLEQFNIYGFKSFRSCEIRLSNLNLFSGANSAGKSSAIQALLTMLDNLQLASGKRKIVARHTRLAAFNEVRNYITNAKSYDVGIIVDGKTVNMYFTPGDDAFQKTDVTQDGDMENYPYGALCENVFYLPAIRVGELNKSSINTNADSNLLGLQGEYIIDFYYNRHKDLMSDDLVFYKATKTLEAQVNYWLNKLTGYELVVEMDGSSYRVKFVTPSGKQLLPYHVGTGISFIAEIIIVSLSAPTNGLIIIENPEIHLHPSAQADMIDFLAEIAKTGRQIIIESHSDHFFNGIRRLLHCGGLPLADVSVYHFTREKDGLTTAIPVPLSQYGGIKDYIPGMFEQFDKDIDDILR